MQTWWVLIGIIAVLLILAFIRGKCKKWYRVTLANNDVMLLYKIASDWWFKESKNRVVFRKENGSMVVFPGEAKWILMYEELDNEDEVQSVRNEIYNLRHVSGEKE